MAEQEKLRIDIVSDVVCPWCIIGYKRLEQALDQLDPSVEVEITWHPFELNSDMPAEGQNLREHIMRKYGTTHEQSVQARQNLTATGEELGFQFNYFDEMRMVNTFRAHQLIAFAKSEGKQHEMEMALFSAFFSEKKDVNELEVLVDAAVSVGLDAGAARDALVTERFAQQVRQEQAEWTSLGITAVPAYVYNGKYLVSGGQTPDVHTQVIEKVREAAVA
jgi:predicted DsbA family dithiol-disulfide isomerase